MLGSVISSVWRLMRGSGAPNPFEPPLLQFARRLHQQRHQLTQQQGGQPQPMTQQQPLQQAEQPPAQPAQPMQPTQPMQLAQPMQPWQPMQPGPTMPVFAPQDPNQFMQSFLGGFTRSMFRRPWSMGHPGQQMPPSQPSLAQILMRLLGR